jgi:hypothetical protein
MIFVSLIKLTRACFWRQIKQIPGNIGYVVEVLADKSLDVKFVVAMKDQAPRPKQSYLTCLLMKEDSFWLSLQ